MAVFIRLICEYCLFTVLTILVFIVCLLTVLAVYCLFLNCVGVYFWVVCSPSYRICCVPLEL
jgi:hypothetical protein